MTVKIAFASDDHQHVNQHFGVAQTFICYEIDAETTCQVDVITLTQAQKDGQEDKLIARIAQLESCAAVYCQAIGASAIGQLLAKGIQPLKAEPGTAIDALLAALQQQLREDKLPAWLMKYFKRQTAKTTDRFAALEEEGWEE